MNAKLGPKSLKFLVLLLFIGLLVSIVCGYKFFNDYETNLAVLNKEKKSIIKDLIHTKNNLELVSSGSKAFNAELVIEREKVAVLLKEIGDSNLDISSIIKYKNEVARLNKVVEVLNKEKKRLVKSNEIYKRQRDSTILVLGNSKKYSDTLIAMNENLKKGINKDLKLSILNLKAEPLHQKNDIQAIPTVKASQVNLIKVSFIIFSKIKRKAFSKQYFIQIIDRENNILGLNRMKKFGDNVLYYSYLTDSKIDNESIVVNEFLPASKLLSGVYAVNIFDKEELVSKTTFTLK